MKYLFSALHSLAASLFLCSAVYRTAGFGAVTVFEVIVETFILYVVFHNNNSSKRYLSLKDDGRNTHLFRSLLKTFASADFWVCFLIMVLPVSLMLQMTLKMPFYLFLAIMLPVLLVSEAQQRRRWAMAYCDYCELRITSDVAEYMAQTKVGRSKKIINMVFGCMGVGLIKGLMYLFNLMSPVLMFLASELLVVSLFALCAIPLAWLLRGFGCMRKRRSTVKTLAEICKQYGYKLTDNTKLLRGLYYSTGKADVIIEKGTQSYVINFLPVPYKASSLVFYTDKKYTFRPRVLGAGISLPLHNIGFGNEEGDKYLLFTKPAARARFWTGRNFMEIDNGEVIYGAKAYSVTAFATYFDRLARKESA